MNIYLACLFFKGENVWLLLCFSYCSSLSAKILIGIITFSSKEIFKSQLRYILLSYLGFVLPYRNVSVTINVMFSKVKILFKQTSISTACAALSDVFCRVISPVSNTSTLS